MWDRWGSQHIDEEKSQYAADGSAALSTRTNAQRELERLVIRTQPRRLARSKRGPTCTSNSWPRSSPSTRKRAAAARRCTSRTRSARSGRRFTRARCCTSKRTSTTSRSIRSVIASCSGSSLGDARLDIGEQVALEPRRERAHRRRGAARPQPAPARFGVREIAAPPTDQRSAVRADQRLGNPRGFVEHSDTSVARSGDQRVAWRFNRSARCARPSAALAAERHRRGDACPTAPHRHRARRAGARQPFLAPRPERADDTHEVTS